MTDREKVIKGLEYHLKELSVGKTCFECPYYGDNPCEIQLIANALALLKEQETVVRCKNCIEYKEWGTGKICMRLGSYYGDREPDDFCSLGIRR